MLAWAWVAAGWAGVIYGVFLTITALRSLPGETGMVEQRRSRLLPFDPWHLFLAPLAVFATTNWVHIPFEEASMRRQFGAEFDAYVSRVRRWI